MEVGKDFLNETQKVLTIKKKDHTGYIKIKTFCSSKIRGIKKQATEWERIFGIHILHKGFISSRVKNPYISIRKRKATQWKIWSKDLNSHFRLSK